MYTHSNTTWFREYNLLANDVNLNMCEIKYMWIKELVKTVKAFLKSARLIVMMFTVYDVEMVTEK